MEKLIVLVVLAFHCINAHKIYENECPEVTPMPDFHINKFLGVWYQVKPDSDSDSDSDFDPNSQNQQDIPSCEFYGIRHSGQRNTYVVHTMFELYAQRKGDTQFKFESVSTNYLTATDENNPAIMSLASTSSKRPYPRIECDRLMTDYESFAILSNCDKEVNNDDLQFIQYASLWSKTRDLDEYFNEKLYDNSGSFDFDPFDLFSVKKSGCIDGAKKLIRVNLDDARIVP